MVAVVSLGLVAVAAPACSDNSAAAQCGSDTRRLADGATTSVRVTLRGAEEGAVVPFAVNGGMYGVQATGTPPTTSTTQSPPIAGTVKYDGGALSLTLEDGRTFSLVRLPCD